MKHYVTYKEIIDLFTDYVEQSPVLNTFGWGNLVDFGKNTSGTTVDYPYMFVTPTSVSYDENTTTYSLAIMFSDILDTTVYNDVDIISQMSLEARRFISYIKRGFDQNPNLYHSMDIQMSVNGLPFMERMSDHIGGVQINANIIVFEDINACDYYEEVSPTPSPTPTSTVTPTPTSTVTPTPTPTTVNYLLDVYTTAKVGYSTRKLSSTSTRSMKVRRSNDNATLDIGFVGEDLDTTTLLSFVGVNTGFVDTWYDQSGNGNDLVQTTPLEQPRIVVNGVLQTGSGSKPTLVFDGTNDHFDISTPFNTVNTLTESFVFERTAINTSNFALSNQTNVNPFYVTWTNVDNNIYFRPGVNQGVFVTGGALTGDYLLISTYVGNNWTIHRNNVLLGVRTYTGTGLLLDTFGRRQTSYTQTNIQEYVLWEIDQTSNRVAIQDNVNNFFSIYP